MRHLLLAFFLLLLAACQTTPDTADGQLLPDTLPASWKFQGRQDYESRYPGLGYSDKYQSDAGTLDIYRYDLRHRPWRPGVADPDFSAHFESTVDEVRYLAERGDYRELRIGAVEDVRLGGQTMRTVTMRFTVNGRPTLSYTYLGALDGRLLKLRLSLFLPLPVKVHVDRYAHELVERSLAALQSAPPRSR